MYNQINPNFNIIMNSGLTPNLSLLSYPNNINNNIGNLSLSLNFQNFSNKVSNIYDNSNLKSNLIFQYLKSAINFCNRY